MTFNVNDFAPLTVGLPTNLYTYFHPSDSIVTVAGINYFVGASKLNPADLSANGGLMGKGDSVIARVGNQVSFFTMHFENESNFLGDLGDGYSAVDI